jgi:hypothetical protein
MSTFSIKRNDTKPTLVANIVTGEGVALNLTNCAVQFIMSYQGNRQIKIQAAANILDAANGTVSYQWANNDCNIASTYYGEFQVTYPDNTVQSIPSDGYFTVLVREDLG